MGGNSSKEDDTDRQASSPWNQYQYSHEGSYSYGPPPPTVPSYAPPPPHTRPTVPAYAPPQHTHHTAYPHQYSNPTSHNYGDQSRVPKRKLDRRYSQIADGYRSLEEVTEALAHAGLESSNLILGIDLTKSNEWTGRRSYNNRSLHHIGNGLNPYEQAISIIGKTLATFDEDNLIPCFGFGDASTHDQDVFSFYPKDRVCNGFEESLSRYRELIPHVKLSGPTSFAPVIEMAMTIVGQSGGQYHVLVIIADGQVTRSVDTGRGQLSPQEKRTVDAIVEASKFPLSIILVGVGDGPWDTMKEFDDNIPSRDFDNFQFVNFTEIMSKNVSQNRKETEFALSALMEIPDQYKATMELGLLGGQKGRSPGRVPLPPPVYRAGPVNHSKQYPETSYPQKSSSYYDTKPSFEKSSSSYYDYSNSSFEPTPSAPTSTYENQICPICLTNPKDMAFGCGHQTCRECGNEIEQCPICRSPILTRIKLY